MKCYNCGNVVKDSIELIIIKGKTIPQSIKKCDKCGKATVSFNEYEEVRKKIHPSIFTRIKNFFKTDFKFVDIHKGKLL